VNVIILAAGYATRLFPLTRDRPKPLLALGDLTVLDRLLLQVATIPGLERGVLVTNHRFLEAFRTWQRGDDSGLALEVLDDGSTSPDDRLGAVRDLALAWDALGEDASSEGVLVVGGDNVIGFSLAPLAAQFRASARPLLLAREIDGVVPPGRYSEVVLDGTRVAGFREKPADPRSNLSCICLYFFTPHVRSRLHQYLDAGGNSDAPGHFLEWLARQEPLEAARVKGPWFDIGNLEELERARAAFPPSNRE
jgi:glucose-1-phosphate thymidylyltransferase